MLRIQTLFRAETARRKPHLSQDLRIAYGGDLFFPEPTNERPYVFANFVTTLDGVVSFNVRGQSEGSAISGADKGDHFIMGLLRASVDAVIVGASTVGSVSRAGLWTAEFAYPPAKELYMRYRLNVLNKPEHPLVVVVTGRGNVDLTRAIFRAPGVHVLVMTTERGKHKLARAGSERLASTTVHAVRAANERIDGARILEILGQQYGVEYLLHEGGPTLFGRFVSAGYVDDLFLTLAPQIAGRQPQPRRPALVEGVAFTPATAPWLSLLSVKQAGSHLYLHYRRSKQHQHSWIDSVGCNAVRADVTPVP